MLTEGRNKVSYYSNNNVFSYIDMANRVFVRRLLEERFRMGFVYNLITEKRSNIGLSEYVSRRSLDKTKKPTLLRTTTHHVTSPPLIIRSTNHE